MVCVGVRPADDGQTENQVDRSDRDPRDKPMDTDDQEAPDNKPVVGTSLQTWRAPSRSH